MKMHLSKVITAVLTLSISAVLVSASILSPAPINDFEVDFDFQIGNSKFSKGTYRLSKRSRSVLVLNNLSGKETKVLIGSPSTSSEKSSKSTLSFNRYGDQYFLRKVISPAVSAKVNLSRDEKSAREEYNQNRSKVYVKGAK